MAEEQVSLRRDDLKSVLSLAAEWVIEAGTEEEVALVRRLCVEHEVDVRLVGWPDLEELKEVLPKPYADYVPDFPSRHGASNP